MLRIKVDWGSPVLPEFDPVKHDPERTFAFLTYRGVCLLYTSPSPRDATLSRMPSSA